MVKYLRGDVGIGTLIVFIAMVLVAAIAATVLLNVSGMLQQRASSTGKETTKQVSSNLIVNSIIGYQTAETDQNIKGLTITLKAAAGSGRLDLKNLMLRLDNGSKEVKLYSQKNTSIVNEANATAFGLVERVDPNNLFDASSGAYVIDSNSIIDLNVSLNVSGQTLLTVPPRSILTVELYPEVGTPVSIKLTTPETYPSLIIPLYP
ncbi:MAG: archaellin/type IV pilin N-terminal domain-containing protein [Candidatus Anstonellales archaeon]